MKEIYLQLFNEKKNLSFSQKLIFSIIIFSFVIIIIESEPTVKSKNPELFFNINLINIIKRIKVKLVVPSARLELALHKWQGF